MEERRIRIQNQDISYQLKYKKMKNMNIRYTKGVLEVHAPLKTPISEVEKLIMKYQNKVLYWINNYQTFSDYRDNGYVYIFGKVYNIVLSNQRSNMCKIIGNDIYVFSDKIEKTIESFLTKELKKYCFEKIEEYLDMFDCKMVGLEIKKYKARWGTYYRKEHRISLNFMLVHIDKRLIDSVIMHELCHTLYLDHSKNFYDEVLKRMPDYYIRDKALKEINI